MSRNRRQSDDDGGNQDREESAGNIRKEEMTAGVEDEGEIRTEERKVICIPLNICAL